MLAQKPLADDLAAARAVVEEAERAGVTLAVNQNARWAPPWRIATLLVEQGAIGEVFGHTLLDRDFAFVLEFPHFDAIEHLLVYDRVHWVDISRCWLDGKALESVRGLEYRSPGQPPEAKQPQGADRHPLRRRARARPCVASAASHRTPGMPVLDPRERGRSGALLLGSDFVELERDGATERFDLVGGGTSTASRARWRSLFAVAEGREPYNSGRHNLLSLELTLAAVRSAEDDGRPVRLTTERIAAGIWSASGARGSPAGRVGVPAGTRGRAPARRRCCPRPVSTPRRRPARRP